MRVGYMQFDPVVGEVRRNLDVVTARLESVEADLIVLPELLFFTGVRSTTATAPVRSFFRCV